ncbi:MAG: Wzz/FepE/Etk N-terminal domain-containing protein [Oceanicaulis sp.]
MTEQHFSGRDARARTDAPSRELDLFDLAAFVWTEKILAVVIAAVLFVPLAALAWISLTPTYEATSRLLVILDDSDLTPGAAGSGGAFTIDPVMQSEIEILNSDAVRRRALEARGAPATPSNVRALRDGFMVSRAPNASVLTARYEAEDAAMAAGVLNAVVDAYLAYRVELLIGGSQGGLTDRLRAAEAEAARAEQALRAFLTAHALSDFDAERTAVLERISDLEARKLSAEAEAAQARGFRDSLAQRVAEIPREIALYVENSVTGQLLDLQVRREELLARYLPDAPPVQAVEREIDALRAFIEAGGAQGQGQTRTGVNPIWQTLEQERLSQDAFAASQSRLAATLGVQLAAARERADLLRSLAPEHDQLARAVEARAEAARLLSIQAADADARRNAPPGAADAVRVVERAAPPDQPSSLRVPAVLAMAMLALGVGVFAALLRGYLVHRRAAPPTPPRSPAPGARRSAPDTAPRNDRPARRLPVLARIPDA